MALVMVQGHVCDTLLDAEIRAEAFYRPAHVPRLDGARLPVRLGLRGRPAPRAPLARAALRRARRLLFVLAVGYVLHLPYFSLSKTLAASPPAEKAALFACDALQVIAVTQLVVIVLQGLAGRDGRPGPGPWPW